MRKKICSLIIVGMLWPIWTLAGGHNDSSHSPKYQKISTKDDIDRLEAQVQEHRKQHEGHSGYYYKENVVRGIVKERLWLNGFDLRIFTSGTVSRCSNSKCAADAVAGVPLAHGIDAVSQVNATERRVLKSRRVKDDLP